MRVFRIIALLLGFYLLCAGLVIGLLLADWFATPYLDEGAGFKFLIMLYLATVCALLVTVRGVFVSTRTRGRNRPGIPVTPAQEPQLWARVRGIAAAMDTRPPVEIRLDGDVNAAVWEDSYLLGLIPGKRRMVLGLPLMMALTPAQMDAVIAHEIGHYSAGHTKNGALVGRARGSVIAALTAAAKPIGRKGKEGFTLPGSNVFFAIFQLYAEIVLSVTEPASRAQEYAADQVAARIAGRANAAAAIGSLPSLKQAYGFYLNRYATSGVKAGLLPPVDEFLGGFRGLLADPRRAQEIAEMRAELPEEKPHRHDSHPPIRQRVAAIEALPDDGRGLDTSPYRAISLLTNPAAALAGVAQKMLTEVAPGKRAAGWDEIADTLGRQRALADAEPLMGAVARACGVPAPLPLAALLDLVDAGRLGDLLPLLPPATAAKDATGRVATEHAKTVLHIGLVAWIRLELAHQGRLRWRHSWSQVADEPRTDPATEAALIPAADALVGVFPTTRPLRDLLYGPQPAAVPHTGG